MPGERIEDITGGELATLAANDKFVVLDTSDTTDDANGTTKYVEYSTLFSSFQHEDIRAHGGSEAATDNQVAVMAAIVAAVASGTNRVYIPAGTWPCDDQVLYASGQNDVTIFGAGMDKSILSFDWHNSSTGPQNQYFSAPQSAGISNITLEDVYIKGSATGTSKASADLVYGFWFIEVDGVYFTRVRISHTSGFGFNGGGCQNLKFDGCYVHNTERDGITNAGREDAQLKNLQIVNCRMHNVYDDFITAYDQSATGTAFGDSIADFTTTAGSTAATGTGLTDAQHLNRVVWIEDAGPGGAPMYAKITAIAGTAITLDRPALNDSTGPALAGVLPAQDIVFANNVFDGGGDADAGGRGIVFQGVNNGTIANNHVQRTEFDGCLITFTVRSATNFPLVWSKDITVTGNTFRYAGLGSGVKHGVRVWGCQDLEWGNNIVSNALDNGMYARDVANCSIGGNFHDNATNGISLDANNGNYNAAYGIHVTANCYRNNRAGITLVSANEVHIDGCHLSDNGYDGGAGNLRAGLRIADPGALGSLRHTITGVKAWDSRAGADKTQQYGIWANDVGVTLELGAIFTTANVNADDYGTATIVNR